MDKREQENKQETMEYCNVCGRILKKEHGLLMEDVFEAGKEWGYFSKKDLEVHHFNICEDCYDKMIQTFVIPVDVRKKNEVL